MIFYQASAPTGWTQVTGIDNRALRVVDGAGGGAGGAVPFTTCFSRTTTDAHTLTTTEIPPHQHSGTTGNVSADHAHPYSLASGSFAYAGGTAAFALNALSTVNTAGITANHNHGFTTNLDGGGGASHTHNMDIRVTYIDVIVCSRN